MGNVRDTHIKTVAKKIFREYKKDITNDFMLNRDFVESLGIENKYMRNKIAGYVTNLHNQPDIISPPYRKKKMTHRDRRRNKRRTKKKKRRKRRI